VTSGRTRIVTADQLRDGYVRVTTINGVDVVMNERYHVLEDLPDGIRSADQDVALHADYRGPGSVPAEVARQRALLDHAGLPLNSDVVAFHMPPLVVLWRDFPEFDSAYATKWRGRYVSDSRRRWSPAKALAVNDRAQVCLHPEHWDV
jgi:hypothetical protein